MERIQELLHERHNRHKTRREKGCGEYDKRKDEGLLHTDEIEAKHGDDKKGRIGTDIHRKIDKNERTNEKRIRHREVSDFFIAHEKKR